MPFLLSLRLLSEKLLKKTENLDNQDSEDEDEDEDDNIDINYSCITITNR